MTRFSAYLLFCAVAFTAACGGNTYTTAENQGTGGSTSSGGASTGGTSSGTGGDSSGGSSAGGGSSGTFVHASDYDQACEWDGECSVVFEGNVCSCNTCANAAIRFGEVEAYEKAKAKIQCPVTDVICASAPCQELVGSCREGTCSARPSVVIDESTFGDQSCDSNDDCTTIPAGEVCSDCRCSSVVVNQSGKAQYDELVANAKCSGGLVACDCAPLPATPYCDTSNGGLCKLAL